LTVLVALVGVAAWALAAFVAVDEVAAVALDFWTSVVLGLSSAVLAADRKARVTATATESADGLFMLGLLATR
jgi:hypothetical protein